eukprot:COSAG06_NODE_6_length_38168_cov_131.592398_21_plen_130_part_00
MIMLGIHVDCRRTEGLLLPTVLLVVALLYLKAHRDGKACGHDCFIPAALLEKGRAAERFLPQFKLNLAAELNEDGSKRFVWGRHIFEAAGVGIIGLTVTPVPASPAGRTGLREARAAPDRAPAVLLSSL